MYSSWSLPRSFRTRFGQIPHLVHDSRALTSVASGYSHNRLFSKSHDLPSDLPEAPPAGYFDDRKKNDYNFFHQQLTRAPTPGLAPRPKSSVRSIRSPAQSARSLTHSLTRAPASLGDTSSPFSLAFSNKTLPYFRRRCELNETGPIEPLEAGRWTSLPVHYQVTRARNEPPHGAQEASQRLSQGLLAELWHRKRT